MIGWDRGRLVLNTILFLIVTIIFDFVVSNYQIWIFSNGRMYQSNYTDAGERKSCRNATFFTIWIQVLCKVMLIGGLIFRRANKFTRE